jgi:hypothetical protein
MGCTAPQARCTPGWLVRWDQRAMRRADRAAAPPVVRLIARSPVASSAQVPVSTPMGQQPRAKRNAGVGRGTDPSCCFAFDARWRAPGLKPWAETAGCSARHTLRCWRRSAVIPRIEGGGCAGGRKTGTHGILTGYSRGTQGVLTGYSRGTQGVLTGYSRGTHGVLKVAGGRKAGRLGIRSHRMQASDRSARSRNDLRRHVDLARAYHRAAGHLV